MEVLCMRSVVRFRSATLSALAVILSISEHILVFYVFYI